MKRLYFLKSAILLLLLDITGLANAQQWQELHTGVTEDLYDVCCIDTNTVFVCGRDGVILKTEDGGNSWQEKYRQFGDTWYRIKFFDKNIGFVLGDDNNYHNKLFKTTDGGESWQDMGSPFNEYNVCTPSSCDLFIVDEDTLYVACDQLMKSIDGGCSFSQLDIEWIDETQDLYFEENVGYIVFGSPGMFIGTHMAKTTDYGASWEEIFTYDYDTEEEGIKKTFFHDKDHVSVYGAFGYDENEYHCEYNEIRTEDGFATYQWLNDENLPLEVWPPITGVCFSDFQNGIMVCYLESFSYPYSRIVSFQTRDGGNTWLELDVLDSPTVGYPAISGCEGVYYLACGSGRVYKLEGTYDGVVEGKDNVYIFPNPVNDRVVIEGIEAAEVQIYNVLGQLVMSESSTNVIGLESFLKGMYFISFTDKEGRRYVHKVVKE